MDGWRDRDGVRDRDRETKIEIRTETEMGDRNRRKDKGIDGVEIQIQIQRRSKKWRRRLLKKLKRTEKTINGQVTCLPLARSPGARMHTSWLNDAPAHDSTFVYS